MENFVMKMSAAEGHIEFNKERQVIWNTLKQSGIRGSQRGLHTVTVATISKEQ